MQNTCQNFLKSFIAPVSRSLFGRLVASGRHDAITGARCFSIATTGCMQRVFEDRRRETSPAYSIPTRKLHTTPSAFARRPRSQPRSRDTHPNRAPLIRLPFGNKTTEQLAGIFKQEVDHKVGNEVLRTLHGRRVTGALVDRGVHLDDGIEIPSEACEYALEWLRAHFPVDEQSAAVAWADQETRKVEAEYIARAERLGIYKVLEPDTKTKDTPVMSVYGKSVLDEQRQYAHEMASRKELEREKSGVAQKERELALARRTEREEQTLERKLKRQARLEELYKLGRASEMDDVPLMSMSQRLALPTLFSLIVAALAFACAVNYDPPARYERLFPEIPASIATVGLFVGINLLVYAAWKAPWLWKYLNRYTCVTPGYPNTFSMLGNIFSQQGFRHLANNMITLMLFGVTLHEDIGRGNWVAVYIVGGMFGSTVSLWSHVLKGSFLSSSQGSSGAVYAVGAAWAYLSLTKAELPKSDNTWSFIYDVSRWATLAIGLLSHFMPALWLKMDGMAHLGGAAMGLFAGYIIGRKQKRQTLGKAASPVQHESSATTIVKEVESLKSPAG